MTPQDEPILAQQGCSDGGCRLRLTPVTGMHTNAGCRCLQDVPTPTRIAIIRKLAQLKAKIKQLENALKEDDNRGRHSDSIRG